jgi:uncharacterized protein YndB with AHSA1/START domain
VGTFRVRQELVLAALTEAGAAEDGENPMTTVKRIQFTANIAAPVSKVFRTMLDLESYKAWTSAFTEGSYYEGTWRKGERIRFLASNGDGMIAEIAELRPNEYISIRHLGYIHQGVEDTESESVRSWAPAYENYTFRATPEGTTLLVDQDVTDEYESFMAEIWPKALDRLKALCERGGAA